MDQRCGVVYVKQSFLVTVSSLNSTMNDCLDQRDQAQSSSTNRGDAEEASAKPYGEHYSTMQCQMNNT